MEEMLSKISLYHSLFLGCLGGALLCLGAGLFLFIRLDIRKAAGFLTGRRARKEIRRLEEENDLKKAKNPEKTTGNQAVKMKVFKSKTAEEKATELLADLGKETKHRGKEE